MNHNSFINSKILLKRYGLLLLLKVRPKRAANGTDIDEFRYSRNKQEESTKKIPEGYNTK